MEIGIRDVPHLLYGVFMGSLTHAMGSVMQGLGRGISLVKRSTRVTVKCNWLLCYALYEYITRYITLMKESGGVR